MTSEIPNNTDYWAYVPLVSWASPPPARFADDFEAGIDNWTPYTNLDRLEPEQWYWDQDGGYGGTAGYTFDHSRGRKTPEDAITLYLGEGSEQWGDYRVSARFNLLRGDKAGIWVRGTYKDQGFPGQWFLGYFCMIKVRPNSVDLAQLMQLRTFEDPYNPDPEVEDNPPRYERNYYHFTNPYEMDAKKLATPLMPKQWHKITVEVRGPNIKCWLDDELAIDHTDRITDIQGSIFLNGTIGLKAFGGKQNPAVVSFDDVLVEPLN
jgi:hypothetical protein